MRLTAISLFLPKTTVSCLISWGRACLLPHVKSFTPYRVLNSVLARSQGHFLRLSLIVLLKYGKLYIPADAKGTLTALLFLDVELGRDFVTCWLGMVYFLQAASNANPKRTGSLAQGGREIVVYIRRETV